MTMRTAFHLFLLAGVVVAPAAAAAESPEK